MNRALPTLAFLLLTPLSAVCELQLAEPTFQERLERLVERLESERVGARIPGMAIAVVKDDEIVLAHGFGLADVEAQRAVTPETLFAVGSTTKAFTATLTGMLVDEGVLTWDDPVVEHLPFFSLQVDGGESDEVSLRDLLSHRTGFTRMGILWGMDGTARETILRTAAGAEPWGEFRNSFLYNNVMFLAAGVAAGKAAHSDWDTLLHQRIFEPLGMDDSSSVLADVREDERLAKGYIWNEAEESFERKEMLELDRIGPAGSINSNVLDMAEWVRFQLAQGRFGDEQLISTEALLETWKPHAEVGPNVGYGLGWFLREWDGQQVVEHGGNIDGFAAQVAMLPQENLGYVLLTNVSYTPLQIGSIATVFDVLAGDAPQPEPGNGQGYGPYLGKYVANFAHFVDEEFTVLVQNDRLAVDVPSQMTFELREPNEDGRRVFALTDEIAVSFLRTASGEVSGMVMHQSGFDFEIPKQGVVQEPDAPLVGVERFLGEYRDPDLGTVTVLMRDTNRLAVDIAGRATFELFPPDDSGRWPLRANREMYVEFLVDEQGRVTGLNALLDVGLREMSRVAAGEIPKLPTVEDVLRLRRVDERSRILKGLGGIVSRGSVRFVHSGLAGKLTTAMSGKDRYRLEMDFGPFGTTTIAALDGRAWTSAPPRGLEELEGEKLDNVLRDNPMAVEGDWREYFSTIEVQRTEELEGRAVIVVQLQNAGGPPRTYYVDAENGDVLKVESVIVDDPLRIAVTTRFADFREMEGFRFPFLVTTENQFTGQTRMEIEGFETGVDLQASYFEME